MIKNPPFQECRAYVAAHMAAKDRDIAVTRPVSLTISRQAGARGVAIGNLLAKTLREQDQEGEIQWTLFDRDLIKQVLEDHQLPVDLEKFMPETKTSELEGAINEILGRHPSLWTLFEYTSQTILRLAQMGHSIIVGRGGNIVTQGMPNVVRARLIGSKAVRTDYLSRSKAISAQEAAEYIRREDAARLAYTRQHLDKDINDQYLYDMVINTDHLADEAVVHILQAAIEGKSHRY